MIVLKFATAVLCIYDVNISTMPRGKANHKDLVILSAHCIHGMLASYLNCRFCDIAVTSLLGKILYDMQNVMNWN